MRFRRVRQLISHSITSLASPLTALRHLLTQTTQTCAITGSVRSVWRHQLPADNRHTESSLSGLIITCPVRCHSCLQDESETAPPVHARLLCSSLLSPAVFISSKFLFSIGLRRKRWKLTLNYQYFTWQRYLLCEIVWSLNTEQALLSSFIWKWSGCSERLSFRDDQMQTD